MSVEKGEAIKLPNYVPQWFTHNDGESFSNCNENAWTFAGRKNEDYTPTADVTLYAVEPCE